MEKELTEINEFREFGLKINKLAKINEELPEIFRNKQNIKIITNYLTENTTIKGIILRGPIGCGKITFLKTCVKNLGLNFFLYDNEYDSEESFNKFIESIKIKKCVILIRDIDNSLKNSQKHKFYKFLIACSLKILMTSHDISIGTTREVPKTINQIVFENPFTNDLVNIGLKFSEGFVSKNAIEKLVKTCNSDIRYLLNQLKCIKISNKKFTIKNSEEHIKNYQLDTFNSIKYCAKTDISWFDKIDFTSSYTNSTIFHNYPLMMNKKNYIKVINLICKAEELRNFAYSNQEWEIFELYYCVLGTIIPMSFAIKEIDMNYPPSNTNIISQTSFEKIEEDSIKILLNENVEDSSQASKLAYINNCKKKKKKVIIHSE